MPVRAAVATAPPRGRHDAERRSRRIRHRARTGIDRSYVGIGIGTALAAHALATAVELNAKAACRAITVSNRELVRYRSKQIARA